MALRVLLLAAAASASASASPRTTASSVARALGSAAAPLAPLLTAATELRAHGDDALLNAARLPELIHAVEAAAEKEKEGDGWNVNVDAPGDGRTAWFTREHATYRDAGMLHWTDARGWSLVQFNVTLDATATDMAARPAAANTTVSAVSFNIRTGSALDGDDSWPNRKYLVVDVIARHDYDFVGLQEAVNFQLVELLESLPVYQHIGVGRNNGDQLGEYSAILYKPARFTVTATDTFWLCDQPDEPGCTSYGNTIPRIVTWGRFAEIATGAVLYVYNTHFDHQSESSRAQSAEQLIAHIRANVEPNAAVLVSGDFNAGENEPPIATMRAGGFVDTFRVLYPNATDVGTFHGFRGTPGVEKIDYVFASTAASITMLEAEIVRDNDNGRYPSDHFPVSATVQF